MELTEVHEGRDVVYTTVVLVTGSLRPKDSAYSVTHMISQAAPLCCASWLVTRNLKWILAEGVKGK